MGCLPMPATSLRFPERGSGPAHGSSQRLWPRSWVKSKDGLECLNRAQEIEHNERNRQRIRQEQNLSDTNKARSFRHQQSYSESRKHYRKPGSCREETHGKDQVRGKQQFLKNGFTFSLSPQHVPFSFLPLFHLALFCAIYENTS